MFLIRHFIKLFCFILYLPRLIYRYNKKSKPFILTYHMVDGGTDLELDLQKELFEKQVSWLAKKYKILSVKELLKGNEVCTLSLTFDDGFDNFYSVVFPLLKKYNLPASIFICTNFIDNNQNMFTFPGAVDKEQIKPMTWNQIRELHASPLITISAHSHTHNNLVNLTQDEIEKDLIKSNKRFYDELGFVPDTFAYPRGFYNKSVAQVISQHYNYAFTTENRHLSNTNHKYDIPRLSVRKSDGLLFFKWRIIAEVFLEDWLLLKLKLFFVKLFR